MRLIFWFLVAANFGLLAMRYGPGLPAMFQKPRSEILVPKNPLDDGSVERVVLLAEIEAMSMGPGEEPHADGQMVCPALGPFQSDSMAKGFVARLSALDVKSGIYSEQISAGTGYWVFLAPDSDRRAVRQRLQELQDRGVDCYIIPKGNLTNGISLGMFSKLNLANKRILELKRMGYKAEYQKIERSYEELWVVLNPGEDQKIGSSAWKMLLKGKNHLKEQQKVCLDVDSQ